MLYTVNNETVQHLICNNFQILVALSITGVVLTSPVSEATTNYGTNLT